MSHMIHETGFFFQFINRIEIFTFFISYASLTFICALESSKLKYVTQWTVSFAAEVDLHAKLNWINSLRFQTKLESRLISKE